MFISLCTDVRQSFTGTVEFPSAELRTDQTAEVKHEAFDHTGCKINKTNHKHDGCNLQSDACASSLSLMVF